MTHKAPQQAGDDAEEDAETRADVGDSAAGRSIRLRLPLKTIDDVKAELARLYRQGKAGSRPVADVSKLAHVLQALGRLMVDVEIAARVAALEERERNKR